MAQSKRVGAALTLIALAGSSAWACLHGPSSAGPIEIDQDRQKAVVLYNAGREELILGVDYEVKGGEIDEIAWVIPVPQVPDAYAEADPEVFSAAAMAWHAARPRPPAPRSAADSLSDGNLLKAAPPPIRLLETVKVGSYEIQPIQTSGAEAGPALNAWLKQNGFGEVPLENMSFYLERDWTWLAAKAKLGKASAKAELRPLQLSFASDEVVYPLKFSTHQGEFAVELFVLTREPLEGFHERKDGAFKTEARHHGFRLEGYRVHLPKQIEAAMAEAKHFEPFPSGEQVVLTRAYHARVNNPSDPIAGWESDLSFKPHPSAKPAAAPATPSATPAAPASGWCALSAPHAQGQAWALASLLLLLGAARRRVA